MKKKVLVSVLACAMLIMGVGYAYWTDNLQVDTKVSTGELKVKFVDLALYGQYAGQDNESSWSIIDGVGDGYVDNYYFGRGTSYNVISSEQALANYKDRIEGYTKTKFDAKLKDAAPLGATVDCYTNDTLASSTIEVDLQQIYPGYAQVFQSDIVNVGTIAAKLSDIDVKVKSFDTMALKNAIGVSMRIFREYSSTAGHPNQHVNVFPESSFAPSDIFEVGGVSFIRLSALEGMDLKSYLENELLYVYPDKNRMDLYFGIAMDPDKAGIYTSGHSAAPSGVSDSLTENKTARFTIDLLWDQFNLDIPAENLNHNHLQKF